MTTLGKTTTGTNTTSSSGNKAVVSSATASASGTLTSGQLRILITSGTGDANLVVYADSGGSPGALLATSDALTISNTTMAWNVFTFSGANQISIANGTTYHVGASWADPGSASFTYERDNTASERDEQTTHNPDPFGTPSLTSGGKIAAYVEFTSGANPDAGLASGTGTAHNAVASSTANTANAGHASGTGTAYDAAATSQAAVGTEILRNVTSGVRLALEVAWGADLTDLDGSGWTWTDITADVQISQGYHIDLQMGATDESAQTQPAQLTVVLDNADGGYSLGPQGANYPNVARNTPVRLRISTNSGGTWTTHYQGNAAAWSPNWDTSGEWATVTLIASGWLRQLNQGTLPAQSVLAAEFPLQSNVSAYWPMEDGKNSGTFASFVSGVGPLLTQDNLAGYENITYQQSLPEFASDDTFRTPWPLPEFANKSAAGNNVASTFDYPGWPASTTNVSMFFLVKQQPVGSSSSPETGGVWTFCVLPATGTGVASGSQKWLCLSYIGGGGIALRGMTGKTTGSLTHDSGVLLNVADMENPSAVCVTITVSGSDLLWTFYHMAIGTSTVKNYSGTFTGAASAFWPPLDILFTPNVPPMSMTIGHLLLQDQSTNSLSSSTFQDIVLGHPGESVTSRLTRLCTNADIPLTVLTDTATETSTNPADSCGPQAPDTLTNLLRECEATGIGRLYDGLNIGLTYVTRLLRESQQPLLTLDASGGVVVMPFAPTFDDQNIVNQATVTRRNGSTYTATDTDRAAADGVYPTSLQINQADDTHLALTAKWVARGAARSEGFYRYPSWTFDLTKQPSLIADWLTCFPSCRVDVTNIDQTRSQHPSGTIRNVLEGWHERISQHRWVVEANTSSYEPWKVITLAADTGSTQDTVGRYESDGSTVASPVSAGATSLSVATPSGPLWTTDAVTADDFPLTVAINGYPITVTGISGGSSPQTFTVDAVPAPIAAGDAVTIYQNAVQGM